MKICPPKRRSEGARRLASTGVNQDDIAARIGVAQSTVARWIAGEKKPGPEGRTKLRKAYGIPEDAWSHYPTRAPSSPAASANSPPPPTTDVAIAPRALALAEDFDRLRREAWDYPGNTTGERAKILETATRILERLGKLTGENQEISQSKIMKLPKWRRMQEALLRSVLDALAAKGLQPHANDVISSIAESLSRLGAEEG